MTGRLGNAPNAAPTASGTGFVGLRNATGALCPQWARVHSANVGHPCICASAIRLAQYCSTASAAWGRRL